MDRYPVQYLPDNNGGSFVVMTKIGELKFLPHPNGLYCLDIEGMIKMNQSYSGKTNGRDSPKIAFMVETVHRNYEGFTKKEVEKAIGARHLQGMLGNPSDQDFLAMVCTNSIQNCNFTIDDCKHAFLIFGKNLPNIIGKTVRKKPDRVEPEYVDIRHWLRGTI